MYITESLKDLYVGMFHKQGEPVIRCFCTLSVPRMVFLEKYKNVEPIENLPDDEQKVLAGYIDEMFPDADEKFKTDARKVVFTLNQVL